MEANLEKSFFKLKNLKRNFPTEFILSHACSDLIFIGVTDPDFVEVCESLGIAIKAFSNASKYISCNDKSELSDYLIISNILDATEILNHPETFSTVCEYSKGLLFPTDFTKIKSYVNLQVADFAEGETDGQNYWRWVTSENSIARIYIDIFDHSVEDIKLEFNLILPDMNVILIDQESQPKLWIRFEGFEEEVAVNFLHNSSLSLRVPSCASSVVIRSNVKPLRSYHDTRPLSFGLMNPRLTQNKNQEIESPSGIVMGRSKHTLQELSTLLHTMGYYFTHVINVGLESEREYSILFSSTGSPDIGIHHLKHESNAFCEEHCINWVYANSVDMVKRQ